MDHVLAHRDGEVAADRAGGGLERVGRADHLARGADCLLALEHHRDERAGGDEAHELAEERLAVVLGVVLLGQLRVHRHVAERDDAQALALEAGDDLAGQVARERIRLDQDEGLVHGTPRVFDLGFRACARRYVCGGGSAAVTACSDDVPPRRRRRAEGGGTAPVSASQNGHSFQAGSIGLPQE